MLISVQVNPATAYNMIHDFTTLQEGDWLVQNGANSAVRFSFLSGAMVWFSHVLITGRASGHPNSRCKRHQDTQLCPQ